MKSMLLEVSGISSRIIQSRTHAPVALKACLLLRFANDGYNGVLEATEALKGILDTPPEKRANLKTPKPRR